jgi:hypothetical protein
MNKYTDIMERFITTQIGKELPVYVVACRTTRVTCLGGEPYDVTMHRWYHALVVGVEHSTQQVFLWVYAGSATPDGHPPAFTPVDVIVSYRDCGVNDLWLRVIACAEAQQGNDVPLSVDAAAEDEATARTRNMCSGGNDVVG